MADPISTPITAAITEIAGTIKEGFKVIGQYLAGKEIARLKYQLESAQNYIFVDEKSGEYAGISAEKQKDLKIHFRKRAFDSA